MFIMAAGPSSLVQTKEPGSYGMDAIVNGQYSEAEKKCLQYSGKIRTGDRARDSYQRILLLFYDGMVTER